MYCFGVMSAYSLASLSVLYEEKSFLPFSAFDSSSLSVCWAPLFPGSLVQSVRTIKWGGKILFRKLARLMNQVTFLGEKLCDGKSWRIKLGVLLQLLKVVDPWQSGQFTVHGSLPRATRKQANQAADIYKYSNECH